jgi:hypothetical protein
MHTGHPGKAAAAAPRRQLGSPLRQSRVNSFILEEVGCPQLI